VLQKKYINYVNCLISLYESMFVYTLNFRVRNYFSGGLKY